MNKYMNLISACVLLFFVGTAIAAHSNAYPFTCQASINIKDIYKAPPQNVNCDSLQLSLKANEYSLGKVGNYPLKQLEIIKSGFGILDALYTILDNEQTDGMANYQYNVSPGMQIKPLGSNWVDNGSLYYCYPHQNPGSCQFTVSTN